MNKILQQTRQHIVILEASKIISEGLYGVLFHSEINCKIDHCDTLDEFFELFETKTPHILIANSMQFLNREKEVKKIRKIHPNIHVVGMDYMHMPNMNGLFDASFSLYDPEEQIIQTISKLFEKQPFAHQTKTDDDSLSEREIEVLTGIVNGLSNKEIAESLNISIHTVATHRKNITAKTGIRSQSGLTIYAISKEIISIDDFS
jgi:DNA-binding NarL/FixJ family response regulator